MRSYKNRDDNNITTKGYSKRQRGKTLGYGQFGSLLPGEKYQVQKHSKNRKNRNPGTLSEGQKIFTDL
jgi:hypothetical protein